MMEWKAKIEILCIAGTVGFAVGDLLLIMNGKSWVLPVTLTLANLYLMLNYNDTFDELARKWGWRK